MKMKNKTERDIPFHIGATYVEKGDKKTEKPAKIWVAHRFDRLIQFSGNVGLMRRLPEVNWETALRTKELIYLGSLTEVLVINPKLFSKPSPPMDQTQTTHPDTQPNESLDHHRV